MNQQLFFIESHHSFDLFAGLAIQCYQCDSNEDETCPSGEKFDTTVNAMLNCNGFEADVPGQFCVKIYQESPGCKKCFPYLTE